MEKQRVVPQPPTPRRSISDFQQPAGGVPAARNRALALLHVGVSGKAQEVLMKHSCAGSYKLEGNMRGERLVPIALPKNLCKGAFVKWAACKLPINKLNVTEQVEQGRVQEIMQREETKGRAAIALCLGDPGSLSAVTMR